MAKFDSIPPPSEEERQQLLSKYDIGAPSEEERQRLLSKYELKSETETEEPRSILGSLGETASDFTRGAVSGLTFGGVEELAAGGKAALESLTSTKDESLEDLYRKYLEIEEKKTRESQERSPVASTLGEIGGAILPAFFTSGASMAATGGSAVGRLAGKEVAKALGKRALTEGAIGAAGGALSGGLSSEGKLVGATEEEQSRLLEDIKSGAISGGLLGGSIGAAAQGLGKLGGLAKDYAGKTVAGKQIKEAFETGAEGLGYVTIPDKTAISAGIKTGVEDATKLMKTTLDSAGETIKNVLTEADAFGVKVSLPTGVLDDAISILKSKNREGLIKKIKGALDQKMDPLTLTRQEANSPSVISKIRNLLKETHDDPELYNALKPTIDSLKDSIQESFEKSPGLKEKLKELGLPASYKKAMENYTKLASGIPETIISKGASPELRSKFISEYGDPSGTLNKSVGDLVSKLFSPGADIKDSIYTMSVLKNNLDEIGSDPELVSVLNKAIKDAGESPEIIKAFGKIKNIDDFKKALTSKIEDAAIKESTFKGVVGESASEANFGSGPVAGIKALGREGTLRAANITGGAFGIAKAVYRSTPANVSKVLYSLPETQLRKVADRMLQDPALSKYGKNLASALAAGDTVKKDAALFLLMQNPKIRDFIPDLISDEEEE